MSRLGSPSPFDAPKLMWISIRITHANKFIKVAYFCIREASKYVDNIYILARNKSLCNSIINPTLSPRKLQFQVMKMASIISTLEVNVCYRKEKKKKG